MAGDREERIPIQRVDADGTTIDGTARIQGTRVNDFRDMAGEPLGLPPGASFVVPVVPLQMRERRN